MLGIPVASLEEVKEHISRISKINLARPVHVIKDKLTLSDKSIKGN